MLLAHLFSGCPIGLDISTRQVVNEFVGPDIRVPRSRAICRSSRFWTRLWALSAICHL